MASKREVIWAPSAIRELDNILDYLENNWSKTVSENFFNTLDHSVELIKLNPYQFPALSKEKRFYKCVVTKHNSIFYSVPNETLIRILHVFDTRQDPRKLPLNQ